MVASLVGPKDLAPILTPREVWLRNQRGNEKRFYLDTAFTAFKGSKIFALKGSAISARGIKIHMKNWMVIRWLLYPVLLMSRWHYTVLALTWFKFLFCQFDFRRYIRWYCCGTCLCKFSNCFPVVWLAGGHGHLRCILSRPTVEAVRFPLMSKHGGKKLTDQWKPRELGTSFWSGYVARYWFLDGSPRVILESSFCCLLVAFISESAFLQTGLFLMLISRPAWSVFWNICIILLGLCFLRPFWLLTPC